MPNTTDPSLGGHYGERIAAPVPSASERPGRAGPYRQPIRRPSVKEIHLAIAAVDEWIEDEKAGFYSALRAAKHHRHRSYLPLRAAQYHNAIIRMKYRRIEIARLLRIRREILPKLEAGRP